MFLAFASEASLPLLWSVSGIEVAVALGPHSTEGLWRELLGGWPGPCDDSQPVVGGAPRLRHQGRAHGDGMAAARGHRAFGHADLGFKVPTSLATTSLSADS